MKRNKVIAFSGTFAVFIVGIPLILAFQNCSSKFATISEDTASEPFARRLSSFDQALELSSKPEQQSNQEDARFELKVKEDNRSLVQSIVYKLDSGEWLNTSEVLELKGLATGNHQVQFKSVGIDNSESAVLVYQWDVDLVKPAVTFNLTPPTLTGLNFAAFVYSSMDEGSGIASFACSLDGIDLADCGQNGKIQFSNLTEGSHIFQLAAFDKAGNNSEKINHSFTVDLHSPTVAIKEYPNPVTNSPAAVFSFGPTTFGDNISSYQCQINDGDFAPCSSPLQLNVTTEGSHRFSVRGYVDSTPLSSVSFEWVFDQTPPTVTISTQLQDGSVILLNEASFQFLGSDGDISSSLSYQCRTGTMSDFVPCSSPFNAERSESRFLVGINEFFVKATDSAGNESQAQKSLFYLKEKNIPFISLNLSGGAALLANIIPLNPDGEFLPSYSKMGLGKKENLPIASAFGANWYKDSGILKGIFSQIGRDQEKFIKVFAIANRSASDTRSNKLDVSGLIGEMGLRGTYLPNIGMLDTDTGIGHMSAIKSPAFMPWIINESFAGLPDKVMADINFLKSVSTNDFLSTIGFDPFLDDVLQRFWPIPRSNSDWRVAALIHNSLNHSAGPVGISHGGYDYHDGTRSSGDYRDEFAGKTLGRIFGVALAKSTPVFVYLNTDGGIMSTESDLPGAPWVSDGSSNLQIFFVVDPSQSFKYRDGKGGYMIGAFDNNTQSVSDSSVAAADTEKVAAIVTCNYAAFNGKSDCRSAVGGILNENEISASTVISRK